MLNYKKIFIAFIALVLNFAAIAQNTIVDNTDNGIMRSNNKIYVVVAVLLTILAGFVFYMVRLDNKISKLEKEG